MADKQSLSNYKVPGTRGPRNMGKVEKPKEGKKTLRRLVSYFAHEKKSLLILFAAVFIVVICSVYAPKLQSNAIDRISEGNYGELPDILTSMLVVYVIHSICTLFQSRTVQY